METKLKNEMIVALAFFDNLFTNTESGNKFNESFIKQYDEYINR